MSLEIIKKVYYNSEREDRTIKYLFRTKDNLIFESVLIFEDVLTVCTSSQIGCVGKCIFCKTGENNFVRNLTANEIVSQVKLVEKDIDVDIDCVSYMGMGEPLLNLDNVMRSMKILKKKHYKISTIGVPGKLEKLAKVKMPIQLYFSLHAPNEHIRQKIIPFSKYYKIEEIIEELNAFSDKMGKINVWYLMLRNINDNKKHIFELIKLLKKIKNIKFIILKSYCENNMGLQNSVFENIYMFNKALSFSGFLNYFSVSEGQAVNSGCGQLRQRYIKELNINFH